MKRKCDFCERLGLFRVVTNYYVQKHKDGRHVAAIKESASRTVCATHLLPEALLKYASAHHMVWRTYDRYTPDGINFDRLLRESVEDCARYRDQTVAKFMGVPWPDGLIHAFASTPSGPYWEPPLTVWDHLRGIFDIVVGWLHGS